MAPGVGRRGSTVSARACVTIVSAACRMMNIIKLFDICHTFQGSQVG